MKLLVSISREEAEWLENFREWYRKMRAHFPPVDPRVTMRAYFAAWPERPDLNQFPSRGRY